MKVCNHLWAHHLSLPLFCFYHVTFIFASKSRLMIILHDHYDLSSGWRARMPQGVSKHAQACQVDCTVKRCERGPFHQSRAHGGSHGSFVPHCLRN
jgi:hypothetical protein